MAFHHVSVLFDEVLDNLITNPDGIYVDCTLGGAGHAKAIAQRLSSKGCIVGLDQDEEALRVATERLKEVPCKVCTIKSNFKDVKQALQNEGIYAVDGFLFDLGVSSYQLDTPERGFSYMQDGPLDMRMDAESPLTAYDVVNTYAASDLERIIKEYGEERWYKRIVEFIVLEREKKPIETTLELVSIIKKAVPKGARKEGPHPAKRTFQAIRIEVNQELAILKNTFMDAAEILRTGGKLCVITFHSLEDRITKQTFKELSRHCICPVELPVCVCHQKAILKAKNKAIEPSQEEVARNPRARSAKLRVAERV